MAQTQLNRVYVQSIDGTGVTVNTLSIGTKALTSGITIGGAGTAANTITVDGGGIRINSSTTLDGTTTIPNLNATTAIVSGNTSLQNTSTLHLGVRGNASIVNASINTLQVLGETTLTNTSITNLGVTSQITLQNTSINGTLNVAGLTTMVNVSTTNLTVINNVSIGGNVSIIGHLRSLKLDTGNASINGILSVAGQTVLQNTSVNTTLNVDGRTTLRLLDVNALAVLNAGLNVSGAVSVDGNFTSSSLTINSGTVLNNVSLTTLTVSGNSSLNAVDIRGAVNINTGGTATTTIGSGTSRTVIGNMSTSDVTVTGTLWATGNTSLQNVSVQALTVGTLWAGATSATTLGATGLATLSGGLSVTSGATTLSGGLTSTAGSTTLGATTATTLGVTGLATLSGGLSVTAGATTLTGGLTSTAGSTTLGATTATTLSATSLATLSGGVTATGAININATGVGLTTIGTTSRTVIGNMSTSDTTVTGSLWVTGATAINKSGAGITEIGSTEVGSRTVIGNTSMIGGVDINTSGIGITMIGSTEFGARTILGNTSMNGSIDINTSGTGITTMGSATSSTVVKGDMSVTKLLTTGYTPSLYNYAPTFFAAGFSGGNVSISNGPDYGFTLTAAKANVSSISPVSFLANKKYIVNFNARWEGAAATVTILGTPFTLTATNTLYRQVVTSNVTTSTLALSISGGATSKIIWSLLTIEPFYDMTLGSNQISLGGEINVSAGNPFTDWDPTRMLFTTSTISIGTNPRIAVGNNNALNASIFLATCDSAVNTSFFTSTDGVTWEQSSYSNASMSRGIAYHEANSSFVMITGGTPAKVWSSSTGNSGWSVLTTTPATMPISSVTNMVYGNSNLVAFNASTANNIIFSSEGKSWTLVTTEVPISITDMVYGKYSGAHVFVACGTNAFYRNQAPSNFVHQAVHWLAATGTKPAGTWAFVGFGNDIFMAASNDATGKVSRSVDGGVNWLTPILLNEILTSRPIYLENTWFIGSNTGLYVSKDDGLTWTKRVGNSLTRSVYGGKFVDVGTSLSLITKRNQRTDGSSISPDVITIGHEGATTVIGDSLIVRNNGVSLAGIVNASSGPVTTEAPFTFTNSYVTNDVPRLAYGNGVFVLCGDNKVYRSIDCTTWTQVGPTTGVFRSLAYGNGIFILIAFGNGVPSSVWTSTDGSIWDPRTSTIGKIYSIAFGNGIFVAISLDNGETSIATTPGLVGGAITWTPRTVTGTTGLQACAFGAMSNGTNVFVVAGLSTIIPKRSIDNGVTWQNAAAIPGFSETGIDFIGFGNDIFMATTDGVGRLTISRDGGLTWSAMVQFGLLLSAIIYIEKKWYIGTNANTILTSNDDGVSWRKVEGPSFLRGIYVNSIFVTADLNLQSVISFKKNRSDGSAITSDVLTIGREGTNATIASDTLTLSTKIYVPPATITSDGGLTFSTDQTTLACAPEFTNAGQRSNQVRIQTFSMSIIDEPSSYSGKNIISARILGFGIEPSSGTVASGEHTFTTTLASAYGLLQFGGYTIGQTYKVVFTLRATTPVTVQISDIVASVPILDFGYIGSTYKTYIGYVTMTSVNFYVRINSASSVKTIVVKHFSLEKLDSPNVLDVTGRVSMSGYVGIGTTMPTYPLHVKGSANSPTLSGSQLTIYYFSGSGGIQTTTLAANSYIGTVTIAAEKNILTFGGFYAASDRRIKTNIVDIEDDSALRDLRLLKPKTYTYTDVVKKGSTLVYGFIAQEVKEVLNYASSYITETLPNVYELATFSGDILTLTFNTADLSRDPSGTLFPKLKLKTREDKDEFVNILEIIDAHTLRVDKSLTDWGGEVDGDQIVPGNRIFVYGQEVSDFHTLNKDAIWTVATAALQEVDRQLQAEKQKTATMQTALDALLERVNALEQKTSV